MTLASPAASQVVTSVLGFLVVAGMGLALVLLLLSMNKQLRKVVPGPRWQDEAPKAGEDSDLSPNGNHAP